MQTETQRPFSPTKKRILITLGFIAAFIVSAIGTELILFATIHPVRHVTASELKPDQVINDFVSPATIPVLSDGSYLQETGGTADARLRYQPKGSSYIVDTPTPYHVLFFAKNTQVADESAKIEDQTTVFMSHEGYTSQSRVVDPATGLTYSTYTGRNVICQLISAFSSITPSYYTLACVDAAVAQQEYNAINTLLTLYDKTQKSVSPKEVAKMTITQANKSLSVVHLTGPSVHAALLFAAINDQWAYLGDLSNVSVVEGKYVTNTALKTAINDPKYGTFLTSNLGQWYYP